MYYVIAPSILDQYQQHCKSNGIDFKKDLKVNPYDESTLFCIAGMQQYKEQFLDTEYLGTKTNVQSCIRMNDLEEIGDGNHFLYFNMLGMFSFRELGVKEVIDFWMDFLNKIKIKLTHVTIHPDKESWSEYYKEYDIQIKFDDECLWSDGSVKGYCTEFYVDDLEIGNIVNPLGTCIDVGFGLERLELVTGNISQRPEDTLVNTIHKLIDSGYIPSNKRQGYVLRKLIRRCISNQVVINHSFYRDELNKINLIQRKYLRLKDRYSDKSKEWWWDTHGIHIKGI